MNHCLIFTIKHQPTSKLVHVVETSRLSPEEIELSSRKQFHSTNHVISPLKSMGAGSSILPQGGEGYEAAHKLKIAGDAAFQLGDESSLKECIAWYSKAAHELGGDDTTALELRAVILSNRCAAYLKLKQFVSALSDAKRSILLNSTWYKTYYRAALACYELEHLEDGRKFIDKALALHPSHPSLIDLRAKLYGYGQCQEEGQATAPTHRRPIGAVYSWGSGDAGQLGLGTKQAKTSPSSIERLEGYHVIEVGAGALHSVAISGTGEAWSWGDNNHCQLGVPRDDAIMRNNTVTEPKLIPKLVGRQAAAVTCGAGHTLVLMENGEVYGWGMAAKGQLGLGENFMAAKYAPEPTSLPYFSECMTSSAGSLRCVALSTGLAHSVFLMSDGSIRVTGMNTYGQLALGHREAQHSPQEVPYNFMGSKVKHVSCGGAHTLVCSAEGDLFSVGSNSCGQLGIGHNGDRDTFQHLTGLEDHTNAAHVSGAAIASATSCKNVRILPLKFAFVHAGEEYSAFISRNKHIYTCGMGIAGSLGHGTLENLNVPTEIRTLSQIEVLAASGQSQLYAINSSGEVYTWGSPGSSSSAVDALIEGLAENNGDQRRCSEPMRVSLISKRKQISQFVCGRKHNHVVINGPYGPNCSVIKGLNVANTSLMEDADSEIEIGGYKKRLIDLMDQTMGKDAKGTEEEDEEDEEQLSPSSQRLSLPFLPVTQLEAGKRLSFTIQSRDINSRKVETPGSVFQASLCHDSLDYERKLKQQGLELVHDVPIDDNLDGQYSGAVLLKLTGTYRLNVTLDGLAIQSSPFELNVNAAALSPPRCFCWFGAFAVTSDENNDSVASHDRVSGTPLEAEKIEGWTGNRIAAAYADTIAFTVSSRDKYGNKCSAGGHTVVVKAEYVGAMGEGAHGDNPNIPPDDSIANTAQLSVAEPETDSESWPGSSLGLFPCAFDTQKCRERSIYLLHVAVDYFGESTAVQGSPFKLELGRRRVEKGAEEKEKKTSVLVESVRVEEDKESGMVVQVSKIGTTVKARDDSAYGSLTADHGDDQAEQFLQELTRAELTQRRAEEALKKHRAAVKARKERERVSKKAKRAGGGFVIEYSREV